MTLLSYSFISLASAEQLTWHLYVFVKPNFVFKFSANVSVETGSAHCVALCQKWRKSLRGHVYFFSWDRLVSLSRKSTKRHTKEKYILTSENPTKFHTISLANSQNFNIECCSWWYCRRYSDSQLLAVAAERENMTRRPRQLFDNVRALWRPKLLSEILTQRIGQKLSRCSQIFYRQIFFRFH